MSDFSPQKIATYYDRNTRLWRLLWFTRDSLGIHYGYYDDDIKTQDQAILRTNETLAKMADIKSTDLVLDFGCGVGGSSIWIAKNIGAKCTGITISPGQVKKANKYSKLNNVSDKVNFLVEDFNETKFPDRSFDIVWGIESICYATDKQKVLKEAYRVLKPGGRIVVSDGFLLKEKSKMTEDERKLVDIWSHGYRVESFATPEEFKHYLEGAGFKNVKQVDYGKSIQKNLDFAMPKAKKLTPIAKILPKIIPYFKEAELAYDSSFAGEEANKRGLWTLQAVLATKPN